MYHTLGALKGNFIAIVSYALNLFRRKNDEKNIYSNNSKPLFYANLIKEEAADRKSASPLPLFRVIVKKIQT